MPLFKIIAATLCLALVLFLAACERLTARGTSSSGSSGSSSSDDGATGLFSVSVQLKYEGTAATTYAEAGSCTIAGGSALASTNSCTITIPEGQLYYSDMKFVVTTGVGTCPLVTFTPYYYQAAGTNPWNPDWDTAANADCTVAFASLPTACFSGPAPELIATFPTLTGLYSVLGSGTSASWEVLSSNSTDPAYSNRRVANNLSLASRALTFGIGGGDGYVMNTMQDYTFDCQDTYLFTNRTITIVIDDDDVDANGGANDVDDWKAY